MGLIHISCLLNITFKVINSSFSLAESVENIFVATWKYKNNIHLGVASVLVQNNIYRSIYNTFGSKQSKT